VPESVLLHCATGAISPAPEAPQDQPPPPPPHQQQPGGALVPMPVNTAKIELETERQRLDSQFTKTVYPSETSIQRGRRPKFEYARLLKRGLRNLFLLCKGANDSATRDFSQANSSTNMA
jgi:hypothetical protein